MRGTVTLDQAEACVRSARSSITAGPIRLDFSDVTEFEPGAGQHLGNSLRELCASEYPIDVVLAAKRDGSPNLILFRQVGLAEQIALYANRIETTTSKATASLRNQLRDTAALDEPEYLGRFSLRHHELGVTRHLDLCSGMFKAWFRHSPERDRLLPSGDFLEDLARITSEAVWNVNEHSWDLPLPPEVQVTSSLVVRWLPISRLNPLPEGVSGRSDLTGYLFRQLQKSGIDTIKAFIDITVNDDGIGVAGRQAVAANGQTVSTDTEVGFFSDALAIGGTAKRNSSSVPGYGFQLVAQSTAHCGGFVSIRSGRCMATFDGEGAGSEALEYSISGSLQPHSGTTLSVLIPVQIIPTKRFRRVLPSEGDEGQLEFG